MRKLTSVFLVMITTFIAGCTAPAKQIHLPTQIHLPSRRGPAHGCHLACGDRQRLADWKAYNNRFWPAMYLVDKQGNTRYLAIGEGNYEHTEAAIKALLAE
jgi:hypothetical protein